jgi:uncharacterized LabA/DUF88 family protein
MEYVRAVERIIIFFDARNIKSSSEMMTDWLFSYSGFIDYFARNAHVVRSYFYDASPHPTQYTNARKKFYSHLRSLGTSLRLKELDPKHPTQKGVDIYLTADMISLAYEDAYDVALIVSGDGDYKALVDLVKSKGKKVWVASFSASLSNALREVADKIILIENQPIFRKTQNL